MSARMPPLPGMTNTGFPSSKPQIAASRASRSQSVCNASADRKARRVYHFISGVEGACSVKSLPQTEMTSGRPLTALIASMPSYGIRMACTRSGFMARINFRNLYAAKGTVKGPSHSLIMVRRLRARAEPDRGIHAEAEVGFTVCRLAELKATGTKSSRLIEMSTAHT